MAAMLGKITRTTLNTCSPFTYYNMIQTPFRYQSDVCESDSKKNSGGNNPNEPTCYEQRKYGHQLATDSVNPPFEIIKNIPSGIFRCTEGEVLGLGAGKECYYQAPEYFSYHHMSFFDISLHLNSQRLPQPDSKRKPP